MRRPFEPEDILEIYQERGLRPCNEFGVEERNGRIAAKLGRCCPLTTCFIGEKCVNRGIPQLAEERWPGFEPWSFIRGYDRESCVGEAMVFDYSDFSAPEYKLGVETAKLLRKHGLL